MILNYIRNKHASTIDLEDGSLLVRSAIEDTFFAAAVEVIISVPDLEITSIKGDISRPFYQECQQAVPLLQKTVGLRIGSGLIKAVNSLVGGKHGCPRMADLILECSDQIILHFTLPSVRETDSKSGQEYIDSQRKMIEQNPRLIGSCIVFAEGSPLRKAVGL